MIDPSTLSTKQWMHCHACTKGQRTRYLVILKDVSTTAIQHTIDATHSRFRALQEKITTFNDKGQSATTGNLEKNY